MQDKIKKICEQIRDAEKALSVAKIKAGALLVVRPKRDRNVAAIDRATIRIGTAALRVERLYRHLEKIEQDAFFC